MPISISFRLFECKVPENAKLRYINTHGRVMTARSQGTTDGEALWQFLIYTVEVVKSGDPYIWD
jgi:hypothetical protein